MVRFRDREGCGTLEFVEREKGWKGAEAIDNLKREGYINGAAKPSGQSKKKIVARYDYRDEQGELLFQVCRMEPKDFCQRRPDGNGWTWKVKGVRRVPYRLPELIGTGDRVVCIVEGEKDADRLWAGRSGDHQRRRREQVA